MLSSFSLPYEVIYIMRIYTVPVAGKKATRWRATNHQRRLPEIQVGETFIAFPSKRDSVPEDIGFVQRCTSQMVYRKRRRGDEDYIVHTEEKDIPSGQDVIKLGEKCVVVHRVK